VLHTRSANMSDVHAVFADLSDISSAEVIADCGSWWKALPKILKLLSLPDAQTEALVDEQGTPLAIFGHYPSKSPEIRTTWFVFSKAFQARGLAVVLASRRRLKALQLFYPGVSFHSYTKSDHPERDRWFSLIGMQWAGLGAKGTHHYVLPKTSDLEPYGLYNPPNPQAS